MLSKRRRQRNNVLFYLAVCIILLPSCTATINKKDTSKAAEIFYQEALMFVAGEDNTPLNYALAISKFKKFKQQYPRHPRAKEAGYWINVLEKLQALKNIELENIHGQ